MVFVEKPWLCPGLQTSILIKWKQYSALHLKQCTLNTVHTVDIALSKPLNCSSVRIQAAVQLGSDRKALPLIPDVTIWLYELMSMGSMAGMLQGLEVGVGQGMGGESDSEYSHWGG